MKSAGDELVLRDVAEEDSVAIEQRAHRRDGARGGRRLIEPAADAKREPTFGAGRRSGLERTVTRVRALARPARAAQARAEGLERVGHDLSAPNEAPERLDEIAPRRWHEARELREEARAAPLERAADRLRERPVDARDRPREERVVIGEVERDAPVRGPARLEPDPHHLAAEHERVEVRRGVRREPRGEDVALERRREEWRSLELAYRLEPLLRIKP